ncbi:MAG: hypothetical protein IJ920_07205, partial [Paludibacteraceae bacterium]|nr:hypothetical protein [Paludibacteraceae bacterium]
SLDVTGDYTYIGIRSNSGALYLDNITVEWTVPGETTYTGYMTTCHSCATVNMMKAATEHGSYTFQQSGISVSSVKTCEAATVDVVFEPELGYELANFQISEITGVSYEDGVLTIAQNAAGNLTTTATFAPKNYSVTMTQTGYAEATLSEDQTNKHMGDEITISTTLPEGYYFVGWEATPTVAFADAKASNTTFTMPASDVTIKAKFAWIRPVDDALSKIPNENDFFGGAAVEGYVSGNISYNDKYKSLTYDVRAVDANGFLTGDVLQVYSGKGIDGADFSSENDIKVGAKVRIYGDLMNYKGTPEFNANSKQFYYKEAANPSVVVYENATKTNYYYNEKFEFDGLKAKQMYENGYAVEIASPSWSATPKTVTESGNVAVTATYADVTSAPYDVAVTKQLRELDSDDLRWSSYDTENILLGYSETPAVRSVINKHNLPVTYRSGDGSVMSVNAETGVITPKASGFASMFVEFEGNEEYAAYNASYAVYVFGYSYIAVSGEATKTAYEAGEKFSFEGLTATAVYTLGEQDPKQVNVTDMATWNASPEYVTADGNIAVTATWQEKTNEPVNVAVTVNKHKVTITTPENGKLSIMHGVDPVNSGDAFVKGTVLNIEVSPAIGYKLATLTVNGNDVKAEKQFEIGTESQYEVVATFIPKAAAGIEWKDPEYGTKAYEGYLRVQGDKIVESDLPVLDNPNGLSIVYSSENTAVAEIDPATGVITPKAEGYTTISATFAGDDDYLSATVNYVLTVAIDQLEFYVIGSFNGWSEFVPVYDTWYQFENLAAGDYQMKVTTTPNWSEAYGYDALTVKHAGLSKNNDNGNICFTISNESSIVIVDFEKDEEGVKTFTVIGQYVKPTFTVVGVEALVGFNWGDGLNAYENEMAEDLPTENYILEKENVMLAAGDYEYQVAMNHDWRYGASNSTLTITESGRYKVTFTYVPSKGETSAVAELIEPIVILPTMKIAGDWDVDLEDPNKWNENELEVASDNLTATYTATNLVKDQWYHFWIIKNGVYMSGQNEFSRKNLSKDLTTYYTGESAYAMYFQADKDGDYTFTWTYDTNVITMTFPYKEATALDNTEAGEKAAKVMQNGQLLIIKNGKTYNAQGAVVK